MEEAFDHPERYVSRISSFVVQVRSVSGSCCWVGWRHRCACRAGRGKESCLWRLCVAEKPDKREPANCMWVVFNGNNAGDAGGSYKRWLAALDKMMSWGLTTVVPGHGAVAGRRLCRPRELILMACGPRLKRQSRRARLPIRRPRKSTFPNTVSLPQMQLRMQPV